MKTERRHELQTNVLADRLAHFIATVEPYSQMILAGVVAVLVLIFAFLYMSARQTERLTEGWNEYFAAFNAQDVTKLATVAESFPKTPVADWGRLITADILLATNIGNLFDDKANAKQEIRRAANLYSNLFKSSDEPVILERAEFGLARAHESLGELSKAEGFYKAVAAHGGAFAGLAKERLEDVKRPEVKEFYDWFAKYEPPSATEKPDKKLDFLRESLDNPNPSVMQLPGSITDKLPANHPALPAAADKAAPAADGDSPAQTEKPADGAAPAADKGAAAEKTPAEPAAEKATEKAADATPDKSAAPAGK